jgi:hypothetical protein
VAEVERCDGTCDEHHPPLRNGFMCEVHAKRYEKNLRLIRWL